MKKKREESVEVDLLQILKALWKKIWAIALVAIACGGIAFGVTKLFITPKYSSKILMYVNNQTTNDKQSITQGDIYAAQSLVDTYTVILRSQSTLDNVIDSAKLSYTAKELNNMISAAAVNSTEVFYVSVESPDPNEAALIAKTIGDVLPRRISTIVDGSSVHVVDHAKVSAIPCSPNVAKNTMLGALVGIVISCAAVIIGQLTNDKINDPDYLVQTYNLPVLAVIPDLEASEGGYGYYQSYQSAAKKQGGINRE